MLMSWRQYFSAVPFYEWIWLAVGVVTLSVVIAVGVVVVRGVAVAGKLTGQIDAMEKRIVDKVTEDREARVQPLAQKVDQIATTAKLADKRADQADKKTDTLAKKQKHVEKVVKPFMDHPRVVEQIVRDVAPLVPEPPLIMPTPETMTPVEPKRHCRGLLNCLFGGGDE
jgi:hypothetical protein